MLDAINRFFIYHPRPYMPDDYLGGPEGMVELGFRTSQGRQFAWYIPPRPGGGLPRELWVLFNGNAGTARGWRFFAEDFPGEEAGFLCVEYPSYGKSEGRPSPDAILDASNGALDALAEYLEVEVPGLERRLNVLGHSLGSGTGLRFALDHPVNRIVLVAPFTSLRDMARLFYSWPLPAFLRHHMDNDRMLAKLAARENPPRVSIIHGTEDEVVPVQMGRQLAGMFPEMVTYSEVEKADHEIILDEYRYRVFELMLEEPVIEKV